MVLGHVQLQLKISEIGEFDVNLKTMYAPRTIKRLENSLPISQLAIRTPNSLALTIEGIQAPVEYQKVEFKKGEIGFEPSADNMHIFLSDVVLDEKMTMLGNITFPQEVVDSIEGSHQVSLISKN